MSNVSSESDTQAIFVQNSRHPHILPMKHWLHSVVSSPSSLLLRKLTLHDNPFRQYDEAENQLEVKDDDAISIFYNVAIGTFLNLEAVRDRPALANYVVKTDPKDLWAVFCSPYAWVWEQIEWYRVWENTLRDCAELFDGYPLEARAIEIPIYPDATGDFTVNWSLPHRWYIQIYQSRIDGSDTKLFNLRVWNLTADKVLVTNSGWENVTITTCTFVRCTFRNTAFTNVQFLECTFTDVGFSKATIQDSLFTHTTLFGTSIKDSKFSAASWSYNTFNSTEMADVVAHRCNWTYISYDGMSVKDYSEEGKTTHLVRMSNP